MKGSNLALLVLVIALLCLGIAATAAVFLVGWDLAILLSLPVPFLVLGSLYAAIGSSPSLLRARTNLVLVLTFSLIQVALLALALDLGVWLAALFGGLAFLTIALGMTRTVGA
jgi:hypothetical protein